jgi:Protein of unknown function (DUF1565)
MKRIIHAVCAALLCLLVACLPAPIQPGFTVRLEPPVLSLRVTEVGQVKVIVNRSGGFAGAVTVSLGGESAGLESAPVNIAANEGTLRFTATDAATIGTSFPVVNASSGLISKQETLTLRVSKPVAQATQVTVANNDGSHQVPQGAGAVTLEVQGGNLERITAFTLGDLELSVSPGRTATRLELRTTVPHGAAPGERDLVLTAAGGESIFPAALTVTAITSAPQGSDATGVGTPDRPFRSMTQALTVAQSGDTVRLLNGQYDAANGERWPLAAAGVINANVPSGVQVHGESTAGVVLSGSGRSRSNREVGLAFSDGGGAKTLTVRGFGGGVVVYDGAVNLEGIVATDSLNGFNAQGGVTTARMLEVSTNEIGAFVVGSARLDVLGGSSHDNTDAGIRVLGRAGVTLNLSDFEVFNNQSAMTASGLSQVRLERVKIHDHRDEGLSAAGAVTLRIVDSELFKNTDAGLRFGGEQLTVRGTKIHDNKGSGVVIDNDPQRVDFGTLLEPGNNAVYDNASTQLVDSRVLRPAVGNPETFTLSATTLNGRSLAPDLYPGNAKWPYLDAPYLSVLERNNLIRAY